MSRTASDVGATVAREALVGPAQRVRRHDDIVELPAADRRDLGRFHLEHVEAGAGDSAGLQRRGERSPGRRCRPRAVMGNRPTASCSASRCALPTRWRVPSVSGQLVVSTKSAARKHARRAHQLRRQAPRGSSWRRRSGSCGNELVFMSNGRARQDDLPPPILPTPIEPSVRPTSPVPIWSLRLAKPSGAEPRPA